MADEQVWAKTHRVTGRLFVIVGLAGFAAALVGSSRLAAHLLGGGLIAAALFGVVYSYVTWRRRDRTEES